MILYGKKMLRKKYCYGQGLLRRRFKMLNINVFIMALHIIKAGSKELSA
jgi:hypothetical protein